MPCVLWPLRNGRPCVQVDLLPAAGGPVLLRTFLADTGAGSPTAPFELILDEDDCLLCGRYVGVSVPLGGAYVGPFPLYDLRVRIPALAFDQPLRAVGLPSVLAGFDGIAGFS